MQWDRFCFFGVIILNFTLKTQPVMFIFHVFEIVLSGFANPKRKYDKDLLCSKVLILFHFPQYPVRTKSAHSPTISIPVFHSVSCSCTLTRVPKAMFNSFSCSRIHLHCCHLWGMWASSSLLETRSHYISSGCFEDIYTAAGIPRQLCRGIGMCGLLSSSTDDLEKLNTEILFL